MIEYNDPQASLDRGTGWRDTLIRAGGNLVGSLDPSDPEESIGESSVTSRTSGTAVILTVAPGRTPCEIWAGGVNFVATANGNLIRVAATVPAIGKAADRLFGRLPTRNGFTIHRNSLWTTAELFYTLDAWFLRKKFCGFFLRKLFTEVCMGI